MSIEVTVRQLREADQSIFAIGNKELPAALAFKVARMIKAARTEIELYQREWKKLLDKHGTPIEGQPGAYDIPDDKQEAFKADTDPLLDTKVKLNVEAVTIDDFANYSLSPKLLRDLDWFILEGAKKP